MSKHPHSHTHARTRAYRLGNAARLRIPLVLMAEREGKDGAASLLLKRKGIGHVHKVLLLLALGALEIPDCASHSNHNNNAPNDPSSNLATI